MSEKRAKRERKESAQNAVKRTRDKKKLAFDAAVALIVVVVLGLGVWACRDKIGFVPSNNTATEQQTETSVATVAQLAESEEMSVEDFLAKCGMSESGLTGESTQEEFYGKLTVANYASYVGKTAEELKAEYGIEDVSDDELWQDAQMQTPMSKVAENYGMSFEEFAEQNGLPESITADMTQGQAIALMQATQATTEE